MSEACISIIQLLFILMAASGMICGLAWGSGIHIHITEKVLEQVRRRREPRPEHQLVLSHTSAFYYGNIAADLINFKDYGGVKNHCHNWNIHERLWSRAENDLERAFILGYLCHLASDVVAHNHFIPYHRVRGLPPALLGHAYWEALGDATVTDEEWEIVARLRHDKSLHQNDRLVWESVQKRALPIRYNKWIFNNILLLNLRRSWRDFIRSARGRAKRYPLDSQFFHHCLTRCIHDSLSVFDDEHLAVLKLRDPTGRDALRHARLLRRELILHHGRGAEARTASRRLAREAYWVF